jgi:hypothetical protein
MIIIGITFILSIIAAIIGTIIYQQWNQRKNSRPLRQIINFGKDDLIFVFSHRDHVPESILPRTSTEDFLAMNNFISALLKIEWKGRIVVRDTNRITTSDRKKNIVSVCSVKTNTFTEELQDILLERNVRFYYFQKVDETNEWQITDGPGKYPSQSYDQLREFLAASGDMKNVAEHRFNDIAVITKITNPWNALNKIFIIAGVRGIGTWAAAECIKKEWKQIYDRLDPSKRNGDFSALLSIKYENCDIVEIQVHNVINIT